MLKSNLFMVLAIAGAALLLLDDGSLAQNQPTKTPKPGVKAPKKPRITLPRKPRVTKPNQIAVNPDPKAASRVIGPMVKAGTLPNLDFKKGISQQEKINALKQLEKMLQHRDVQARIRRDRNLSKYYRDFSKLGYGTQIDLFNDNRAGNPDVEYFTPGAGLAVAVAALTYETYKGQCFGTDDVFTVKPADREYLNFMNNNPAEFETFGSYLRTQRIRLPR